MKGRGAMLSTFIKYLLLASFLLQGVEGQLPGTTIFGLHTDASPSPLTHTWIQREFDFPDSTTEVTVCFSFQLHFTYGTMASIMSLERQLGFVVQDNEYAVLLGKMFMSTAQPVVAWQWTHVCIVYSTSPTVLMDGRSTSAQLTGPAFSLNLGGAFNLTMGLPSGYYDRTHTAFGGYITIPQVYSRRLTRAEMASLAHCGPRPDGDIGEGTWDVLSEDHVTIGSIVHDADSTDYTPLDSAASVPRSLVVASVPVSKVCPPHPTQRFVMVSADVTNEAAESYCSAYGGSVPSTTDPAVLDAAKEVLDNIPQLSLNFWAANGGQGMCKLVTFRYGWDSFSLQDEDCGEEVSHLVCKVSSNMTLKLRYNDLNGDGEDKFYLVPDGVQPRFVSLMGYKILPDSMNPNILLLLDKRNDLLATARAHSSQPLGRYDWSYANSNMTKTMTLTTCSTEEFTCDDGWCFSLSKRCDGHSDCRDASDESCTLLQPLQESYRANRPHQPRTPLQLSANLLRIHDVDVDNNVMDACIQLITEWEDDRLLFSQLSSNPSDNSIEGDGIWTPRYRLQNAEFLDAMAYVNRESVDVNIRVHRAGKGVPNVVHGMEGYMYTAGTNAYLERREGFKAGYICDFQLGVYPFDVHECHMKIGIHHTGEFKAFFNISALKINSEASVLNLYTSSHMCYDFSEDDDGLVSSITFKILLTRRYGSYVFTTFMPCLILSVIGSCTQFFGYTNFSDRIMVTLSCLIVVAALFSQVAVTAPASAVPKAIDIFFFYSTIRLFITFLHHSMLFLVQMYVKRHEEKASEEATNLVRPVTQLSDGKDDVPDAATYVKPKIYLPITPWLEANRMGSKGPNGNMAKGITIDRAFNVVSIIFGYILDFVCGLVFYLWVTNTRDAMAERFEQC